MSKEVTPEKPIPQQLTLFAEGFLSPASLGVQQEKEQDQKMTVTSGLRCLELSKKSGQLGLLVKMLLESSAWHSKMCVLTWKTKALKSNRLLFQLVPKMRSTEETGFGLLATPNTMDGLPPTSEEAVIHEMTTARPGRSKLNNLRDQVYHQLLPTPRASDHKATQNPTVASRVLERGFSPNMPEHMAIYYGNLLPTPTALDHKDSSFPPGLGVTFRTHYQSLCKTLKEQGAAGRLNPEFVEVLMGYPKSWTQL